ncbi:hypothetical protein DOY81_004388 [Sarcophaga bullata]|nr:hypothetical protein DOY81_004388 [Sarcophaga bullata]
MGKSGKQENKSKKKRKHKERKEKRKKSKKLKKHQKEKSERETITTTENRTLLENSEPNDEEGFAIPVELMDSKSHAPETPEEYQERQNRIRREIDPTTGRLRLIKGDGEILEEIVSKERHKAINKEATKGDGTFFQANTLGKHY